mgnify:CR=1 FL=1
MVLEPIIEQNLPVDHNVVMGPVTPRKIQRALFGQLSTPPVEKKNKGKQI